MDFSILLGVVALVISIISLWQGWRTGGVIKKTFDDFNRANNRQSEQNERQADQIDALIKAVNLLIERL